MIDRRQLLLGGLSSAILLPSSLAEAATSKTLKPVGSPRILKTNLPSGSGPVQIVSASSSFPRIARVELLSDGSRSRLALHNVGSSTLPMYDFMATLNGRITAYFAFADGRRGFITQSTPKSGGCEFSYTLTSTKGVVASGYPIRLFTSPKNYVLNLAYPIGGDRFLYSLCLNDFGPASRAAAAPFTVNRIAAQQGKTLIDGLNLFEFGTNGVFSEIGAYPLPNGDVMLGVASHEKIGVWGDIQLAQLDKSGRLTRGGVLSGAVGQLGADAVFGTTTLGRKFCIGSASRLEKIGGVAHLHFQMVGAIEQKDGRWTRLSVPEAPSTMGYTFRACPLDLGRILVVWGSTFDVNDDGVKMVYSLRAAIWNPDGSYYCKPVTIAQLPSTGLIDDVRGTARSGFLVAGRLTRRGSTDGAMDAFALPLTLE
ncbi:hypothetical protein [Oryzibacter oryziterrae]|uniref:hypothetical protein n=1 Tax=Oryzibacter oryziterrae TaxID=2766474 RepID=UPI001F358976|nr:hypothetical protein [Oryzibacter oryziterrae]